MGRLADTLNAEIVAGTVNTLQEAAVWLGYTYLYVRMLRARAQAAANVVRDGRVEARRDLVEREEARVGDDALADGDALLLAA